MGNLLRVLFTFALALTITTGCARPKSKSLFQRGERTCSTPDIGSFSVSLEVDGGNYTLKVTTIETTAPGGINVRGYIANETAFADLFMNRLMKANDVLYEGTITPDNLSEFPYFVVNPVSGSTQNPLLQPGLVCEIPTATNTINTQQ